MKSSRAISHVSMKLVLNIWETLCIHHQGGYQSLMMETYSVET
jgi:hypothetical protein